jgi:hypothetical protein
MTTSTLAARPLPRDIWNDACGAAVFVSFLVILAHVVVPLVLDVEIPYAGGAAAVLIIGATICLGLDRRARGSRSPAAWRSCSRCESSRPCGLISLSRSTVRSRRSTRSR